VLDIDLFNSVSKLSSINLTALENERHVQDAKMSTSLYPELGCYLLPGHSRKPAELIREVRDAEELGLGSAWVSERFDVKEAGVCIGAAAAVTERIHIGTAATNINTRHVMSTAAMASSAHHISNGRFALGIARGVGIRQDLWGIPKINNTQLRDFSDMMKKLWRGERIMGYDGALGKFPYLHMADWLDADIPQLFVGFGPKSLSFAGSVFDGVILHTFLSDEALQRATKLVRQGAERAGRDPDSVKVWSVLACGVDPSEEQYLRLAVARMATYLQAPGYGELLVAINDWDSRILESFRAHPTVANMPGGIDSVASLEQLREIQTLIPEEWLPAAIGSADYAAQRIQQQFKAGANGVILHASTAAECAPAIAAYGEIRNAQDFIGRTNRPA
jgi:probable F420-dependent oxidoreductase